MSVLVEHGDMLQVLPRLADDGVLFDACVTDPPYHLASIVKRFGKEGSAEAKSNGATGVYARASRGFMGKEWDGGDVAFRAETWRKVYHVLKPGAHVLAFGATKNFGFMQVAIAEAGFEIRDCIAWMYGSGFPKSHNLDGEWDGWGSALKPAFEPVIVARKPLDGTIAGNVAKHGCGALNIDGCRIAAGDGYTDNAVTQGVNTVRTSYDPRRERRTFEPSQSGRWPANVVHDGSPEVLAGFPETGQMGSGSGSGSGGIWATSTGKPAGPQHGDSGSAARFFYTAKATKADRLESKHPTVKPVGLMRWLVRLVTPPKGLVLDPFAGSGTTGMACMAEGFDCVLVEREAEYVDDIKRRLDHVRGADIGLFASICDEPGLFDGDAA